MNRRTKAYKKRREIVRQANDARNADRKITAIKLIRDEFDLGLKEAYNVVVHDLDWDVFFTKWAS